jgi:hypothetical protein
MRSEDIQECLEMENGRRNWMEPKKLEGTCRKYNPHGVYNGRCTIVILL